MYPILFRVGGYIVYAYSAALALGLLAGTYLAYRLARRHLPAPGLVLDGGFWAFLGGIGGARAGYVLANWAYFREHLAQAVDLRGGGLSWHGALIGGAAAAAAWYAARRAAAPGDEETRSAVPDWAALLDVAAPGLALGAALGWLGCLLAGACYGAEAAGTAPPLSWLAADLPDVFGIDQVRFLVQPLMIAWSLALCVLLWLLRRRPDALPPGAAFAVWLFLYAAGDLSAGSLRGDGMWRLGLWLAQWFAMAEMVAAAGLGLYAWLRARPRRPAGAGRVDARVAAGFAGSIPEGEDDTQRG